MLKLPAGPPVEHLLMTQQLGTVIFATQRLPESLEGLTCAVLGQGSAGLFWDTVLKRRGASRIIAIEPVDGRRALSTKYGADETVDVTGEAAKDAVHDLTDGKGADIVIEAGRFDTDLEQRFPNRRRRRTLRPIRPARQQRPCTFRLHRDVQETRKCVLDTRRPRRARTQDVPTRPIVDSRRRDRHGAHRHASDADRAGDGGFLSCRSRAGDGVVKVALTF